MSKKEPLIHEHPYYPGDIFIYIAGVILLFAIIIIFWPYVTVTAEASVQNLEPSKYTKIMPVGPDLFNQYDLDKSKYSRDIFLSIQKAQGEKPISLQRGIWMFLTNNMGLSDVSAAGIFGNMMVECGYRSLNLQPYVYSPGNAYYGLCQWCTTNHHSGVNGASLEDQLLYLQETIESEMGSYEYERFCNAQTPEEAANIFGQWYERCREPYGRQSEARIALEYFT